MLDAAAVVCRLLQRWADVDEGGGARCATTATDSPERPVGDGAGLRRELVVRLLSEMVARMVTAAGRGGGEGDDGIVGSVEPG